MNDQNRQTQRCPICGNYYREPPAISRIDNRTEICGRCGVKQALDAAGLNTPEIREPILQQYDESVSKWYE